jgi:hypothetical protein
MGHTQACVKPLKLIASGRREGMGFTDQQEHVRSIVVLVIVIQREAFIGWSGETGRGAQGVLR